MVLRSKQAETQNATSAIKDQTKKVKAEALAIQQEKVKNEEVKKKVAGLFFFLQNEISILILCRGTSCLG